MHAAHVLERVMADRVALRSSIVSSLTRILGSDQSERRAAEEELKALEVTEGQPAPASGMHTRSMKVSMYLHLD